MPQRKRKKHSASDLSHHFRVQPKANYKMYGTRIVLDKSKRYWASDATNQPRWKAEGKVFVWVREDGSPATKPDMIRAERGFDRLDAMLLKKGEYTKKRANPTRRRNKGHDWIQGVDREIEEDGTEGAFTKQARRAGYSNTMEFARKVMAGWRSGRKKVWNKRTKKYQGITERTMYRANFAINAQKNPSRRKNSRAQRKALGKRMYLQISPSVARKRTWGTGNERKYNEKLADLAGQIVEVDTKYLFEDQYNLKDHDLRGFDRDVVEVINDQRKGMQKSHWSGKWGPARGKGADDFVFAEIDAMAGSKYAKPEDIYAMQTGRMRKKFKAPKKSPVPTYMRGWTATKVAKVFKNGNVLLDNGTRLVKALGKYDGNNSKPRIGQKVYRNSGGTHFWVKEFPDRYDPEDRRVLVRVPRKGGGKYHTVRPISRATGISEKKLLSMSIPQFVFAASKARL